MIHDRVFYTRGEYMTPLLLPPSPAIFQYHCRFFYGTPVTLRVYLVCFCLGGSYPVGLMDQPWLCVQEMIGNAGIESGSKTSTLTPVISLHPILAETDTLIYRFKSINDSFPFLGVRAQPVVLRGYSHLSAQGSLLSGIEPGSTAHKENT